MSGLYVRASVPSRNVEVEFGVAAGEVVAVLGPNGAGKSTALHLVAGLAQAEAAHVRLGERVLTDTDSAVFVPTHDRRVGMLMQDALLFPHLSAAANVAFAPRSRRRGRAESRRVAERWLRQVGADHLADRKPRQLSGGQAQRVAIARALAAEPDVLLLDEPMAGLDVGAATSIRAVLHRVLGQDGRAALLVTHDVLDVLTLADRVLVIDGGRVVESGTAAEVLAAPRSAFAARLAGVNLINGTLEPDGVLRAGSADRWHGVAAAQAEVGAPAVAVFSPAAVAVFATAPHGSPRNVVELTVAELDVRTAAAVRLRAAPQADGAPGLAADVTAEAVADLRLAVGSRVWFAVKAQEVAIHPAHRTANPR